MPKRARTGREAALSRLILTLYQSALDDRHWDAFLSECADLTGAGSGIALASNNVATGESVVLASTRMDPAYLKSYKEYYGSINVYVRRAQHRITLGVPQPGEALLDDSEMERSEYFTDFMRPQSIYHSLGVAVIQDGPSLVHLGTVRPKRAGAFGVSEIELLEMLAPHLQCASRLRERFSTLQAGAKASLGMLDRLGFGAFVLDGAGKLLESNRYATSLLNQNDGLQVTRREMSASRSVENTELQRLIRQAILTSTGEGLAPGGTMQISRRSLQRPYWVLVTPLALDEPVPGFTRPAAVVFVSDPEAEPQPNEVLIRKLFGLTGAESRLAALLAGGDSVASAAQRLHITRGTVRTHLKRILSKTQTRRQSDLVRLVLNSPARLLL